MKNIARYSEKHIAGKIVKEKEREKEKVVYKCECAKIVRESGANIVRILCEQCECARKSTRLRYELTYSCYSFMANVMKRLFKVVYK